VGVGGSRKYHITENTWEETVKDHASRLRCERSALPRESRLELAVVVESPTVKIMATCSVGGERRRRHFPLPGEKRWRRLASPPSHF
jgi:hypothetical protein